MFLFIKLLEAADQIIDGFVRLHLKQILQVDRRFSISNDVYVYADWHQFGLWHDVFHVGVVLLHQEFLRVGKFSSDLINFNALSILINKAIFLHLFNFFFFFQIQVLTVLLEFEQTLLQVLGKNKFNRRLRLAVNDLRIVREIVEVLLGLIFFLFLNRHQ